MKNLFTILFQSTAIEEVAATAISPVNDLVSSTLGAVGEWAPRILGAILALIVGLWLVGMLTKAAQKALDRTKLDSTLKPFVSTVINFTLKIFLFISIAGVLGLETTSFAALLVGVGAALGAAFNGSLGHIASGVMLLIFRPFKVGDLIETNGQLGFVKEISVFVTVLETFQNKTVILPNSAVTAGTIINYTTKGNLRVDMPFAIRYGADIKKAKAIVLEVLEQDSNVLKDPAPRVAVNNLGTDSVELLALPYSTPETFWDVHWDTRQKIVEALGNAGFEAPLPQRVVTMVNK